MDRRLREHIELWESLIRAQMGIVERLEQELQAEQGLALSWYEVLLHLSRSPDGRMRMQDLANSVLQSKSGLTRLVDRMEAAGLVSRELCPSDRRGVFAAITPAGKSRLRRAAPLHVRGIENHFGRHLVEVESGALRSLLERLLEAQPEVAWASK